MKKMFAMLMTLALLCGCVSCRAEGIPMVGGWTVCREEMAVMLPDECREIFDQAAPEGFALVNILATQVVAGVNYAFLARNEEGFAIVKVYRDLQGNATVTGIAALDVTDMLIAEEPMPTGLMGGWTVWDTGKPPMLPTEGAEIAYETAVFAAERTLKPVALLATQLVSGTNYKVLAQEDGVLYVVTVYQPLAGDAVVMEILPLDLLDYLAG